MYRGSIYKKYVLKTIQKVSIIINVKLKIIENILFHVYINVKIYKKKYFLSLEISKIYFLSNVSQNSASFLFFFHMKEAI